MAGSNVNQDRPDMLELEGQVESHRRNPWRHHPHFTEAELRVIEECKRESLLYRALPLAAAFGALTFAAVMNGFLTPNARLGAWPKVVLASVLGYGIGKLSYRKTCTEKMMALSDSSLGQFLKERRGGFAPWGFGMFGSGGCPKACTGEQVLCPQDLPLMNKKIFNIFKSTNQLWTSTNIIITS